MEIKEVWAVFKNSSMQDMDMQRAFERSATPNACIELLEEIDELNRKIDIVTSWCQGNIEYKTHVSGFALQVRDALER